MNREAALEALRSPASRERLRGAQYFVENGAGSDVALLVKTHAAETDTYVRRRLELALGHGDESRDQGSEQAERVDRPPSGELTRATEWVGGVFTHEIEGPIGRVAYRASREVPNYEASKTKREIDHLKGVFAGVSQLVVASRPARPEEFDLSALVDEIAESEASTVLSEVTRHGPRPFVITGDRSLLRLALANGVKNAVEAIESVGAMDAHAITVTWGQTDRDFWVSVIDHGPGPPASISGVFRIGATTKAGHSGFGLAIALRAMESMNGAVTLQGGADGGARYEVRWERH
jgi:nitrogen-specific signal transduction histidine kinase